MAQTPPFPPDLKALFEWTRLRVSEEDRAAAATFATQHQLEEPP